MLGGETNECCTSGRRSPEQPHEFPCVTIAVGTAPWRVLHRGRNCFLGGSIQPVIADEAPTAAIASGSPLTIRRSSVAVEFCAIQTEAYLSGMAVSIPLSVRPPDFYSEGGGSSAPPFFKPYAPPCRIMSMSVPGWSTQRPGTASFTRSTPEI